MTFSAAAASFSSHFPSIAEIKRILVKRIDEQRQSVGIVVGTFGPEGRHIVSHGNFGAYYARPVDADTGFEIGSITKVFTTLLLAEMAGRGEVGLDDPVAMHLPATVHMAQRNGREVTLTDLATHTSGLPRLPENMAPSDDDNPYADYSVEQMYAFLAAYELPRDIGSEYEYSNLGMGLLGHVLARRAGMSYGALIRERILAPLDMRSTADTPAVYMKSRLANGHDAQLMPVLNWDLPTLAGAGALLSTADDMLNFVEMLVDAPASPLHAALATTLAIRRPTGTEGDETGLGWVISGSGDDQIVWHNGGTGGYRSYLGFMPAKGVGVVALSNTSTEAGVDDIGRHLLNSKNPLAEPPRERVAITLDPAIYDRYVGTYRLAPQFEIAITREGAGLFAQATGQGRLEIFAENQTQFFLKAVNAQLTFDVGSDGAATGLTLHQNGIDQKAPRAKA
ncbi:CubicO group peptidase (beta-lactamase class C family) [Aminobacter lissarensis]|uniref:CubicO group peptidase (Beta-lactamase class C family) n=1 Tax=Aminobacter carboxidus TaxID=376165 RepID=A0A8E1WAX5_9HYPH|nr:serine hydrolase [Aminobacter lissarensis]MBB6464270.1 CubicO group peptidase (beta-lactamase class C family) [Aminobacter lissarensis]